MQKPMHCDWSAQAAVSGAFKPLPVQAGVHVSPTPQADFFHSTRALWRFHDLGDNPHTGGTLGELSVGTPAPTALRLVGEADADGLGRNHRNRLRWVISIRVNHKTGRWRRRAARLDAGSGPAKAGTGWRGFPKAVEHRETTAFRHHSKPGGSTFDAVGPFDLDNACSMATATASWTTFQRDERRPGADDAFLFQDKPTRSLAWAFAGRSRVWRFPDGWPVNRRLYGK